MEAQDAMDSSFLQQRRQLGQTGIMVSPLGFGASPLGNEFGAIDDREAVQAVHEAIRVGINFFDVSPYYGRTKAESLLGRALHGIPRDSFVLGTKVGRYDKSSFDFSAERVVRSVHESMARLGVDYLDIVHCHDIEFGDLDLIASETIPALVQLKQTGKIRAIGITGYPLEAFPYVLSCAAPKSIDIILSYCNFTLQNDRLARLAQSLKQTFGVGVINASPLCMGLLTDGGCPPWHPGSDAIKQAAVQANNICKKNGSRLPALALQYAIREAVEDIDSTLVGIESRARLRDNVAIVESKPDPIILAEVHKAFESVRNETWSSGRFLGRPG